MKHLYFVRHGESKLNVRRLYSGQLDTPLTEEGQSQAKAAGIQAKNLHFDLIISSPLTRALETAQIIAKEINYPVGKIITNDIFKERSLGSLEGKFWDEYAEDNSVFTDVETAAALLKRANASLTYLKSLEADDILLVGHGSFSRALRTAIDPSQTYDELPNAQIIKLI